MEFINKKVKFPKKKILRLCWRIRLFLAGFPLLLFILSLATYLIKAPVFIPAILALALIPVSILIHYHFRLLMKGLVLHTKRRFKAMASSSNGLPKVTGNKSPVYSIVHPERVNTTRWHYKIQRGN